MDKKRIVLMHCLSSSGVLFLDLYRLFIIAFHPRCREANSVSDGRLGLGFLTPVAMDGDCWQGLDLGFIQLQIDTIRFDVFDLA